MNLSETGHLERQLNFATCLLTMVDRLTATGR